MASRSGLACRWPVWRVRRGTCLSPVTCADILFKSLINWEKEATWRTNSGFKYLYSWRRWDLTLACWKITSLCSGCRALNLGLGSVLPLTWFIPSSPLLLLLSLPILYLNCCLLQLQSLFFALCLHMACADKVQVCGMSSLLLWWY